MTNSPKSITFRTGPGANNQGNNKQGLPKTQQALFILFSGKDFFIQQKHNCLYISFFCQIFGPFANKSFSFPVSFELRAFSYSCLQPA
jgi:hypothetical protein